MVSLPNQYLATSTFVCVGLPFLLHNCLLSVLSDDLHLIHKQ